MNLQKTPKTKDQEQAKPKTNQPTKKKPHKNQICFQAKLKVISNLVF